MLPDSANGSIVRRVGHGVTMERNGFIAACAINALMPAVCYNTIDWHTYHWQEADDIKECLTLYGGGASYVSAKLLLHVIGHLINESESQGSPIKEALLMFANSEQFKKSTFCVSLSQIVDNSNRHGATFDGRSLFHPVSGSDYLTLAESLVHFCCRSGVKKPAKRSNECHGSKSGSSRLPTHSLEQRKVFNPSLEVDAKVNTMSVWNPHPILQIAMRRLSSLIGSLLLVGADSHGQNGHSDNTVYDDFTESDWNSQSAVESLAESRAQIHRVNQIWTRQLVRYSFRITDRLWVPRATTDCSKMVPYRQCTARSTNLHMHKRMPKPTRYDMRGVLESYFLLCCACRNRLPSHVLCRILALAHFLLYMTKKRKKMLFYNEYSRDEPYIVSAPISGWNTSPVRKVIITLTGQSARHNRAKYLELFPASFQLCTYDRDGQSKEELGPVLDLKQHPARWRTLTWKLTLQCHDLSSIHISTWILKLKPGDMVALKHIPSIASMDCYVESATLEIFTIIAP